MSYFKDLRNKILGNEVVENKVENKKGNFITKLSSKFVNKIKESDFNMEHLISMLCSNKLYIKKIAVQLVSKKLKVTKNNNVDDICNLFTNKNISNNVKFTIYSKNAFYINKIIDKGTFLQISQLLYDNVPVLLKKYAYECFIDKIKTFDLKTCTVSNNPLYFTDSILKILTDNKINEDLKIEILLNTKDRMIEELKNHPKFDHDYLYLFNYNNNEIKNILLSDVRNKISSNSISASDLISFFRYKGITKNIKESLFNEYSDVISKLLYNCKIDDYKTVFKHYDTLHEPVENRMLQQLNYKFDKNILNFKQLCNTVLYLCKYDKIKPQLKSYFFKISLRNIEMSVIQTGEINLNYIAELFHNINNEWSQSFIDNIDIIVLRNVKNGQLNIDTFVKNNFENDFNMEILNKNTLNIIKDLFRNRIKELNNCELIKKLWNENYNQGNEIIIEELKERIKKDNNIFEIIFKNYEWFKNSDNLNIYKKLLKENSKSLPEYLNKLPFDSFINLMPRIKGVRNIVLNSLLSKVMYLNKEQKSIDILLFLLNNAKLKDEEIIFIYDNIKLNMIDELSKHINDSNYVINVFNTLIDLAVKKKKTNLVQNLIKDFLSVDFNKDIINYIKDKTIKLGMKGDIPYAPEFVNSIMKERKINEQNKSLR